jgi:hypothetical protein
MAFYEFRSVMRDRYLRLSIAALIFACSILFDVSAR